MSQAHLARAIGMSQRVVNNYATGKRMPSMNVLRLICDTLKVTSDYLIELSSIPQPYILHQSHQQTTKVLLVNRARPRK